MDGEWNDSQPIYRQLRDRVIDMILDGVLKEGDPLPSVRNVAAESRVHPFTVLKSYQQLVDEQLVEKKRGLGIFVKTGARSILLAGERQKYLAEQWPRIYATIQRLGLTPEELLATAEKNAQTSGAPKGNAETMACIEARGLRKAFGKILALDSINLRVQEGRILGLIGLNGAGKTTALKAILGLTSYEGELKVLGHSPWTERDQLMRDVSFIADVAGLPRWLRVTQAVDYVAGVHPRFDRAKAERFLAKTTIRRTSRVRELSKGMVAQLHLALVMAINAKLLVLDEPTLGLDILYRKRFYDSLLNDYFDRSRTIIVTTHQVERFSTSSPTSCLLTGVALCSIAAWKTSSRATLKSWCTGTMSHPRGRSGRCTSGRYSVAAYCCSTVLVIRNSPEIFPHWVTYALPASPTCL